MTKLLEFVSKVRKALEQEHIKKTYESFHDFPLGSCMDASILLGMLLVENGFEQYELTATSWEKLPTHSWLQNKKHIIDITADQFADWPKQKLIIPRYPLPSHYAEYKLQWADPVLEHQKIPAPEFYKAYRLVEEWLVNN